MKLKLVLIIALFHCLKISGQSIDASNFTPATDELRGKLLFVTECHEVKTNLPEYFEIIKSITFNFKETDTLNIIIEAPFTVSYFINKYFHNEGRTLIDSVLRNDPFKIEFYFNLRKLKKNIRFIATDFEYDHGATGGRLEAYKMYFEELKNILEKNKIDLSVVKSFIYGIRVQGVDEADVFTFKKYIQKLAINQPDSVLKLKLKEANFVLSALHLNDKLEVRDKATYSRLVDLLKSGINTATNFNLLIYGAEHANPYLEKSLFNKLNIAEDSPFKSNVKLFANIYIECLSYGSYNQRSLVQETVGLYPNQKEDKELITLLSNNFKNESEGSCKIFKNNLSSPLKGFQDVLYWGIHYKVK